jgi:hypothetical protein
MALSLVHERDGCMYTLQAQDLHGARQAWADEALHLENLNDACGLQGCLACGHPELYTRRDFPRRLGLAIVILAAVLAPFTYYLSLLAAALVDALLYRFGRTVVVCYCCEAVHAGFVPRPRHPRYDLGVAERLRYGPKAVMGTPMRPAGTAGAPEPEH